MASTIAVKRKGSGEGIEKWKVLSAPAKYDPKTKTVIIEGRKIKVGGPVPKLREGEKFITYTASLCPVCYRLLPAVVFERDGKVWIRKVCPEHGEFEELYFGDASMYKRFVKYEEEGRGVKPAYVELRAPCPFNCGLCPMHRNHSALINIVVTNRCNLKCWYCFFYAEKFGYVYEPSLEQIRFMIRRAKAQGVTLAVQITGGEPTLREDLVDIIRMLKEEGVRHIQLNTNGIKFAELYVQDPVKAVEYARSLRQAGLNTVYLSFDGVTPKTNWKNHWEVPFIFEVFRKAGVTSVVLVPTVIKGVNTHELGAIIKFAGKHIDVVRGVNFQPVSLTGMMPREEREKYRVTIPDAIRFIEEQTEGQIYRDAWYPIPVAAKFAEFVEAMTGEPQFIMANHPACGAATYVFVEKGEDGLPKRFIPITDFFDVEGFVEYLEEKSRELRKIGDARLRRYLTIAKMAIDLRKFVDAAKIPKDLNITKLLLKVFVKRNYEALGELHYKMLFLGMMHFMDLYNYDVARVTRCNIHYAVPDGRLIPFCTFNVLSDIYRDAIQKKYGVPIDQWKGELGLYKRPLLRLMRDPIYYEAYKGIVPDDVLKGKRPG